MVDHAPRPERSDFPELELDLKPSVRADVVDEPADAVEPAFAIELDAPPPRVSGPPHGGAQVAAPLPFADTIADDSAPGSHPLLSAASVRPALGVSASYPPSSRGAVPHASAPPSTPHVGNESMPPASGAMRRDAHLDAASFVATSAPVAAPAPSRAPAEIARDIAAAGTRTVSGLIMIGAAILLTVLDLAYTRATGDRFPIRFTWISVPLALIGGVVVGFRLLREHPS